MRQYKRIVYNCAALLFTVLCATQAQTKAVPDDPTVPHFIKLESTAGGTLTGTVSVEGTSVNLMEGKNLDLPHATRVSLTATPETGKQLSRVTKTGTDGKEIDLGLSNLPTSTAYTFNYMLEQSVILKAHFASQVRNINWELENLTSTNQPTNIEYGGRFDFTLVPDPGYLLPEKIDLGHWEEGKEFSYDPKTGEVKILVDMEYALTIRAVAIRDITASMKWNSFSGRYFETDKACTAEYGIKASDRETPLLFRYTILDYETWKGSLEMTYADNYEMSNPKPLEFSDNGAVDILSTDCKLLPDAYNIYFGFTSTKAGRLRFKVEVYDKTGSRLYATLEEAQALFAIPVSFTVSPEVKGKALEDIDFGITIEGLGDLSIEGEGTLGFNIHGGLKAEDLTLMYGNGPITLQEKDGILYGSASIASLRNESYSFTLNSKVPLTEENKIEIWLKDKYYTLPFSGSNEILPEISIHVEAPKDDKLGLDIPDAVEEGMPLELTLKPIEPSITCRLPRTIEVVMNGVVLEEGLGYTYGDDGRIRINEVNGNIEVRAFSAAENEVEIYYMMKALAIKYTPETTPRTYAFGEPLLKAGEKTFTLTAEEGYELPSSIIVKVDGEVLTLDKYTYMTGPQVLSKAVGNQEIGTLTIQEEVFANATVVDIIAEGISSEPGPGPVDPDPVDPDQPVNPDQPVDPDQPTSITNTESADLRVWATDGCLHIQTPISSTAYIITFGGQLYKALTLPIGETMITIPQGAYIIRIENQSYKIRF